MERRIPSTIGPAVLAVAVALTAPETARAQGTYGDFTYLEQQRAQGTLENLIVPDTASTLGSGARLFFRCGLGRPEVFVSMAADSLAVGPLMGRYRFAGEESPTMARWSTDEEGIAAFLPADAAQGFADRAAGSDTVTVGFVTPGGEEPTFVFPLRGFADGVEQLSCFSGSGSGEDPSGPGSGEDPSGAGDGEDPGTR